MISLFIYFVSFTELSSNYSQILCNYQSINNLVTGHRIIVLSIRYLLVNPGPLCVVGVCGAG